MDLDEIKKLRAEVLEPKNGEELEEAKRIKVRKARGTERVQRKKKNQAYRQKHKIEIAQKVKKKNKSLRHRTDLAELGHLGPPKKGTRRVTSRTIRKRTSPVSEGTQFDPWMEDVSEAVDMFIGMPADVLPADLPWGQWFAEGMSPTKAAKSAVEMCRDLEEEKSLGDTDEHDLGNALYLERRAGAVTYGDWYAELTEALSESGISLEDLKGDGRVTVESIQGMYKKGYDAGSVASVIVKEFESDDGELSEQAKVLQSESEVLAEELGVDITSIMADAGKNDRTAMPLSQMNEKIDMNLDGMPTEITESEDNSDGAPMEEGFMDMICDQTKVAGTSFPGAIDFSKIGEES